MTGTCQPLFLSAMTGQHDGAFGGWSWPCETVGRFGYHCQTMAISTHYDEPESRLCSRASWRSCLLFLDWNEVLTLFDRCLPFISVIQWLCAVGQYFGCLRVSESSGFIRLAIYESTNTRTRLSRDPFLDVPEGDGRYEHAE